MLKQVQHDGWMVAAALLLAGAGTAAAAAPVGPSVKQFTALRAASGETCPPLRQLSCKALGDPTEYKCSYQEQFDGEPWITSTALVARDGSGWTWLDGGPRCSPLVQK